MMQPQLPNGAITPGREYHQPRNVWKRETRRGRRLPLVYTALGLFTVPVEVLLRRNFGQRWLTPANFLGGLFILGLFAGIEWALSTPVARYGYVLS